MRSTIMTMVRHIYLPQPRTSRATIGCPGCEENPRAYADLIYQTALAVNKEKGTDEAENGRQEKGRAAGKRGDS